MMTDSDIFYVYLIDDSIQKLCCLSTLLEFLNKLVIDEQIVFEDGFKEHWEFSSQYSTDWYRENQNDMDFSSLKKLSKIEKGIPEVLANPEIIFKAIQNVKDKQNGVFLLDFHFSGGEYFDASNMLLEMVNTHGLPLDKNIMQNGHFPGDNVRLGLVLTTICKSNDIPFGSISTAAGGFASGLLGRFGCIPIAFPDSIANCGDADGIGAEISRLNEASETILNDVLRDHPMFTKDDIVWFTKPPDIADVNQSVEWFHYRRAHSFDGKPANKNNCQKHLNAVKTKYPNWGKDLEHAKALVHSKQFELKVFSDEGSGRKIPKRLLADFFGEMEASDFHEDDRFSLPFEPALPFLVALKELFTSLESGEPIRLRKLCEDYVAIGVKPDLGTSKCHWKLCFNLWMDQDGGASTSLFKNALKGTADPESDVEDWQAILKGSENYICMPCITDDFIGVSWKTSITKVPTE